MHYKTTTKLFRGIYQYKVVLVVPGASAFRTGDMARTLQELKAIDLTATPKVSYYRTWRNGVKTQEELDYAFALQARISKITDFDIRVENPFISIYTNNKADLDKIANIDNDRVKYICQPNNNTMLVAGSILLPKIDFDYKVTLAKTTCEHSAFVDWAIANKNVRLTSSCIKDLLRPRSWGGTYFYITGENNLLLAKMHLGGSINKIERVIKA